MFGEQWWKGLELRKNGGGGGCLKKKRMGRRSEKKGEKRKRWKRVGTEWFLLLTSP